MLPRLDLYLGRDPVFDDVGDDSGEAVAGRLTDRGVGLCFLLRLGQGGEGLAVDQALTAFGANGDEATVVDHAAHGVDADAQGFGGLSEAKARHFHKNPSIRKLSARPGAGKPLAGPPLSRRVPPPNPTDPTPQIGRAHV